MVGHHQGEDAESEVDFETGPIRRMRARYWGFKPPHHGGPSLSARWADVMMQGSRNNDDDYNNNNFNDNNEAKKNPFSRDSHPQSAPARPQGESGQGENGTPGVVPALPLSQVFACDGPIPERGDTARPITERNLTARKRDIMNADAIDNAAFSFSQQQGGFGDDDDIDDLQQHQDEDIDGTIGGDNGPGGEDGSNNQNNNNNIPGHTTTTGDPDENPLGLDLSVFTPRVDVQREHLRSLERREAVSNKNMQMHAAIAAGDITRAMRLSVTGADPKSTDPANGRTLLHYCADGSHVSFAPTVARSSSMGKNPLNSLSIALKTFIRAADAPEVDARANNGDTALHVAFKTANEQAVKILIAAGADVDVRDGRGKTCLHHAASAGKWSLLKVALEAGADVDAVDVSGMSALHYAAKSSVECVRELLGENASVTLVDRRGMTARDIALSVSHSECVSLIDEAVRRGVGTSKAKPSAEQIERERKAKEREEKRKRKILRKQGIQDDFDFDF